MGMRPIDQSVLSGSVVCKLQQKMNPSIFFEDEPLPDVPASRMIWAGDIRHNWFCLHAPFSWPSRLQQQMDCLHCILPWSWEGRWPGMFCRWNYGVKEPETDGYPAFLFRIEGCSRSRWYPACPAPRVSFLFLNRQLPHFSPDNPGLHCLAAMSERIKTGQTFIQR